MHQRITGVLVYFDYMRVADTINSQKSEDRGNTRQITITAASNNQTAVNAIANI
jgi:hypothetical protein